ncbi:acetylornithine transaminase [Fredinandcohnia quinoae]|uniref:Acetylornithine aminotransferase n=1 Tax=Fredinandcohnia quinoae TaxID=2918902 RepID=A0AAW5E0M7_9BACI|nr:acetylornithine transaminase [Fredinandcohnia sp. SECRCQ15]MCH1625873.1 acetylornithine transaminase [Fredinandcohnia sp. SECRCQ15]
MDALFPTYAKWDIVVEIAEGSKIIDKSGKEYLDFVSGIAVCNLGHRNPVVQQAIQQQLDKFWHVSNLFHTELQQEVAGKLVENCDMDSVFFCNSGAEANEAALKLARKYTQKSKVITFKQSFHGRTFGTMAATGQDKIHSGFGPLLQEFVYLPYNDCEQLEKEMDDTVAAILVEVIQGEGGVIPASAEFLETIQNLCQKFGALFIIDEVQTGIGRTGKAFAYQHFNISPDIMTLAKGLGSGLPIGAMLGKEYLREAFGPGTHGSTFGGNLISLAAAKATLDIIFHDEFMLDVEEKGEYLSKKLNEILGDQSWMTEVRGKGLIQGIACQSEVVQAITAIRNNGLLVLPAGQNVIRLLPPLTVSYEEIDKAVNLIEETLVNVGIN